MRDAKLDLDRRGIQSVEIGMRVISVLAAAGSPLSLKALSAAAELPASNCHRYCVSFVRTGYLRQNGQSGAYELGPKLIQSGLAALGRTDAIGIATQALESLVDATGHTGQLAVWADGGPTIIRWIPGRMAVRTSVALGSTLPLFTSATGRVFHAFLPSRQTASIAAREIMAGGDPATSAEQVRMVGMAQVSGEHIPGLSAIAAPILDVHGEAVAVITLVAARGGIAPDAGVHLRNETQNASCGLGWLPPANGEIG